MSSQEVIVNCSYLKEDHYVLLVKEMTIKSNVILRLGNGQGRSSLVLKLYMIPHPVKPLSYGGGQILPILQ